MLLPRPSWQRCPLDEDEPHAVALGQKWCDLDLLDSSADELPAAAPSRPPALPPPRPTVPRRWCDLDLNESSSAAPPVAKHRRQDNANIDPAPAQRCDWRRPLMEPSAFDVPPRRGWHVLDLEDGAMPEADSSAKHKASLSAATLAFLSNLPTKQALNAYDRNGMDPTQIRKVLQK